MTRKGSGGRYEPKTPPRRQGPLNVTMTALRRLLDDLAAVGVILESRGGRLRFRPQELVTPELLKQLREHKTELLAILRRNQNAPKTDITDPMPIWQTALDRLEGDPLFPANMLDTLRAADVQWTDKLEESTQVIDPPDPCPECGTLELWQTLAGEWRCTRCDPPTKAQQLRELAARLRSECPTTNENTKE